VLFLVRDAIDLALSQQSSTPAWAAAYGYYPGRSPFAPLPDSVDGDSSSRRLAQATNWPHPWLSAGNPSAAVDSASGRRLAEAAASPLPPVPAGKPPKRRHHGRHGKRGLLGGADSDYGDYAAEGAAYADDAYDAEYYE
jgi:hypothetical protein